MQKRTFSELDAQGANDTQTYELFTYRNGFLQHSQRHTHDYLEIGICLQGSGLFFIGNKVFLFKANSVSIIEKGIPHIAQSPNTQPSEWIFINVKSPLLETPVYGGVFDGQEMFWLLTMIVSELQNVENKDTENVLHLMKVLISIANRQKDKDNDYMYNRKLERILPALNLISQKYKEAIKIEDLASACHFNIGYFRRIFKEQTNCSPVDYIRKVRLKEAALLLSQTKMSVLEISQSAGFQTLSHFNRSFLSYFGVSPTKYRKQQCIDPLIPSKVPYK